MSQITQHWVTNEGVMSQIVRWVAHVRSASHMNESCHVVMSHVWKRRVTNKWVMWCVNASNHMSMSQITHYWITNERVLSHIVRWVACERDASQMNESFNKSMRCVTCQWVTSLCDFRVSYNIYFYIYISLSHDVWFDSLTSETMNWLIKWLINLWRASFICDQVHTVLIVAFVRDSVTCDWTHRIVTRRIDLWYDQFICDAPRSYVTQRTYERDALHVNGTCHVARSHVTYQWVMSHITESRTNESRHTVCSEPHVNETRRISMSRVT